MTPDSSVLRGLAYDVAASFGMPHVSAYYRNGNVNSNAFEHDAACAVCGGMATNSHHEPPKGAASTFTLFTRWGAFPLRPALIAVCGSGTTGCHGERHSGKLRFRWVWDDEEAEVLWWDGYLLAHGYQPHDERLWAFGHWEIMRNGKVAGWIRHPVC